MANKPKDTKKDKPAKDSGGGGGGKQKRKKWSKGKTRDKLNNLVLFDKATYDKFVKEVPSYKLITPSVVSERLKIRGSLARAGLKELVTKGLIRVISRHHSQEIYTKIQKDEPEGAEKVEKAEETVKQPKAQKGKKAAKEAAAEVADE